MNHPRITRWLKDDCSHEYTPRITDRVIYLTDGTQNGIARLDPVNGICCQVHFALLPDLWGTSVEFGKGCIKWAIENTQYMKAIAIIPVYNRLTISLAKKCGFKKEGLIKKSFLKDWKLHDQAIFGITELEFREGGTLCQQ